MNSGSYASFAVAPLLSTMATMVPFIWMIVAVVIVVRSVDFCFPLKPLYGARLFSFLTMVLLP
jgi:hypothetical protein